MYLSGNPASTSPFGLTQANISDQGQREREIALAARAGVSDTYHQGLTQCLFPNRRRRWWRSPRKRDARSAVQVKCGSRAGGLSVGRERRSPLDDAGLAATVREQRLGKAPPLNDLYLLEDNSRTLHISGVHFTIECVEGLFFLIDRGSACGTIVAGRRIGGHRKGGRTELRNGDEVVIGTGRSRYIFRFHVTPSGS